MKPANRLLITALTEWQKTRIDQERDDVLPTEIAIGLLNPDPRYVYDNMEVFCNDHLIMHYAAEYDCVPLFRLRFEKLNDTELIFDGEAIPVESFHKCGFFFRTPAILFVTLIRTLKISITQVIAISVRVYIGRRKAVQIQAVEALLEHPDIDLKQDKVELRPFYGLL